MTSSKRRRALLIAIDGLRPDALKLHAPNMYSFGQTKASTTWNSHVDIPISASSWATIFTGLNHKHTGSSLSRTAVIFSQ